MDDLPVHVEGIGWWSPGVSDWASAAPLLRDGIRFPVEGDGRPAAALLAANERRRAPEPVLLACDVAGQACAMAGWDPAQAACVFASMHGDIGTTDILCTTLAHDPLSLSPIRFHNSVHNAPTGYWTVATHCHAASSAVSAWRGSFAAGLFEAALASIADETPVLFAAYDIAARGPLADVLQATAPFAVALLLNHERGPRTLATLHLCHESQSVPADAIATPFAPLADSNPIAACVMLFAALARGEPASLRLRNGAATALAIKVGA